MANRLTVSSGLSGSIERILGVAGSGAFYNAAKSLLEAVDALRELFDSQTAGELKSSKIEATNKYTISFEVGGGSVISSQTVLWKEQATKPDDPVKDRYSFDGWFLDEALTQEYDFATKVTSSFTLYAKWTLVTAKITYNALNNKALTTQYVTIGEYATPIENPEKSGYIFSSWCTNAACTVQFDFEGTIITGDMVLYAAWEKLCSVFFDSQGGTKVDTQSIKQGSLCYYPLTPEKTNYVFLYWTDTYYYNEETGLAGYGAAFDFSTSIEDDITLYAVYEHVSNTLSFNSMKGSDVESQTIPVGELAEKPENPTREGYSFVRWTTDEDGTDEFYFDTAIIQTDTTIYANWRTVYVTVSFDSQGGTEFTSQSIAYGEKAVFPGVPEKEGATFLRWSVLEGEEYTEYDFSQGVKANLTIYAEWR